MGPRKCKIAYVAHIILILDCDALESLEGGSPPALLQPFHQGKGLQVAGSIGSESGHQGQRQGRMGIQARHANTCVYVHTSTCDWEGRHGGRAGCWEEDGEPGET